MNFVGEQDHHDIEFNLIPLIDVILCLLIFFMVTTTFEHRSMLRVDLPEASESATEPATHGLALVIDADGRYFVDNREVIRADADALRTALEDAVGVDRQRSVLVRADARTPHQSVVTALDVLGRLGFARISIATVPVEVPR